MANLLNPTLDVLTADIFPRFYVQNYKGALFHATTATTGIAIAAVGTAAGFVLANPAGSKKILALTKVNVGLVSGTYVVGTIMHGGNSNTVAAAVTGTVITPVCGNVGSGFTPVGKTFVTATLPAAQTAIRPFFVKNATAATGAWFQLQDAIDGDIILQPGTAWSLFMVGTDTTPVEIISCSWEELDL